MSSSATPVAATGVTRLQALWQSTRTLVGSLASDFVAHGCQKNAAALTYMTLFAIVPLMTVVYSVFSMIPAFDGVAEQLQDMAFAHFVPKSSHAIQTYIADFSRQARSLTAVGVGMLVVTAYLMLTNIEKTLNEIWGVERARKGLPSFLLYWAVLSIGPILLGAGLAINTYILSLELLFQQYDVLGITAWVFRPLPLLLEAMAFTLLFVAVPNCRVPLRDAAIGGSVTAVGFELLKIGFGAFVSNTSMTVVYGAFAVIPLFLLWVNLVWTVILAGAILVRTMAEQPHSVLGQKKASMVAALKCLLLFRQRREAGDGISDDDCYRLGMGVVSWQQLRTRLERAKWIAPAANGRYVLTRDLQAVTLWDLALILELKLADLEATSTSSESSKWLTERYSSLADLVVRAKASLGVTIEDLLKTVAPDVLPDKVVDLGVESPAAQAP